MSGENLTQDQARAVNGGGGRGGGMIPHRFFFCLCKRKQFERGFSTLKYSGQDFYK